MVQRPIIVNESYTSHDKEKEQCLLVPSHSKFICCTACMHFASVHSWLSQECLCHLELGVDEKFTYCRSHIVSFLTTNDAFCH